MQKSPQCLISLRTSIQFGSSNLIPLYLFLLTNRSSQSKSLLLRWSIGDWEPARSDWFLVEEGDAKNFVHIATSAEGKFVVNVWANNKIMLHENQVSAIENSPEELLSYKLVSELSLAFRGIKELKTLLKDDQ